MGRSFLFWGAVHYHVTPPPNPRPRGGGFVSVGGGKVQRFYSVREFERIVSKNQPKIDYILTSNDDDMGDLPF